MQERPQKESWLSFRRVSRRSRDLRKPLQPWQARRGESYYGRARCGYLHVRGYRRCGARKRRSRPSCSLLSRVRRYRRHSARRIRHSLQIRPFPSGIRERLPEGVCRRLAAARRPLELQKRRRECARKILGFHSKSSSLRYARNRLRWKDHQHPPSVAERTARQL